MITRKLTLSLLALHISVSASAWRTRSTDLLFAPTCSSSLLQWRRTLRTSNLVQSLRGGTQKDKQLWIEPLTKDVLLTSIERGYTSFAFRDERLFKEWQGLARFDGVVVRGDRLVQATTDKDVGRWVQISDQNTQKDAMALAGKEPLVVLDSNDWKVIPAENLIAAFQPTNTRLLAVVSTAQEAKVMLETLEVGTDGVVLRTASDSEVLALSKLLQSQGSLNEELVDCEVLDVRPVGMGDRVCVDTCSLLTEEEGLLVGSAVQGLFLVLSEAAQSQYVPSRPFRVNAGPVQSYCLCPGNKTKYLAAHKADARPAIVYRFALYTLLQNVDMTRLIGRYLAELRAGDQLLVVSARDGATRVVTVGRVKIERRPLLLVRAATREGEEKTTRLRLRREGMARHVGMAVQEWLKEA